MSKLIKRNAPLLHFLGNCKNSKQLKAIVGTATDDQLAAIVECNHNIIKGTVPLTKNHLAKCKRRRKLLLDLDEDFDLAHLKAPQRKIERRQKRKRILQKGGILPLLLAPVLGAIVGPIIKAGIGAVSSTVKSRQIRKVHERQHIEHMRKLKKNKK